MPSPVVVPDKESPQVPNSKRKLGCCRACVHIVFWLYDLGSVTSKVKRCSMFKLWLVKQSSRGLRLVVVAGLSLMSTSLQRNVSCSASAPHAYASFPTTRTETQRAGVIVRLKEQQSNLFRIMASRDSRKSQTLSIRVEWKL